MPIVLVHGVPETDAIWDPLDAALGRSDVIRLSPPGFGAPVPDGFTPNRAGYAAWLAAELGRIDEPVDVVGHDWGGGHVAGVVATEPDLVHSWVIDVAGIFHPEYVWHDMAQTWRTPAVGEEAIDSMMGAPTADKLVLFESLGMPGAVARRVAEGNDATMGRCILELYRSADPTELRKVWDALPQATSRPGLCLVATADHFVGPRERAVAVADRAGAAVRTLEDLGHWWMLEDPSGTAATLNNFWADLDR